MEFKISFKISISPPLLLLFLGLTYSVRTSLSFMSTDVKALPMADLTDDYCNSECHFGVTYDGDVSEGIERTYVFQVGGSMNKSTTLRVEVSSSDAQPTQPLFVVVTQEERVISWRLPLGTLSGRRYDTVARTLCPIDFGDEPSDVTVRVTCSSPDSTHYSLIVNVVDDFQIGLSENKTVTVSPSKPKYYYFKFPNGTNAVEVRGYSEDAICVTLSVQNATCPVFDLPRNVRFTGKYQTFTKKSSIPVKATKNFCGFFIVLVVHQSDTKCTDLKQSRSQGHGGLQNGGDEHDRIKNVTIKIIQSKTGKQYGLGIGVISTIYIVFCVFFWLLQTCYLRDNKEGEDGYRELEGHKRCRKGRADPVEMREEGGRSDDNKSQLPLSVADLSKKPDEEQYKKYKLYWLHLIPIAIFYLIPVLKVVLAYQIKFHGNGNEDVCYYNFLCANSLFALSSFNNIFSNVGYIFLGMLFMVITQIEERAYKEKYKDAEQKLGLPRYFGIFYALGIALIMEGIHSACYHVCPTHGNFQFDTSYMYIMVGLSTLKLYQGRNSDITSSAHVSYTCLALVIFVTVIGVVFETLLFWIIFTVFYIVVTLVLSAKIYYVDGISCDALAKSLEEVRNCCEPKYQARSVLLGLGIVINVVIALTGAIVRPKFFATYMLLIFLVNSMLYTVFYMVMKFKKGERILPKSIRTILFIVLTIASWVPALYFFVQGLTKWEKTPAESREGNRDCLLFDFYDHHDVWHFLSAFGLFFTFMTLLTLDDDVDHNKPRKEIPAF
ncbi:SID1 transmembrane family member 1-like [Ptychodera flava]|uniref:SID1 transmembrane family member 1-like n=1 Tax=Ptychodera flava TaxID=63121 RepID=UPI00396A56FE